MGTAVAKRGHRGGTPAFASELARVIGPVQGALRQLLAEWGSPGNSSELDRMSGAGVTICWQVFRVAGAADGVSEARNVPSPTSLKRLLKAAEGAGISAGTIEAVVKTTEEFRTFSKRAASDRAAFDSMVAGVAPEEGGEKISMAQRRATCRGMSHIRGIQTELLYCSAVVKRVGEDATDEVGFMAQCGIRRLRPDAQMALGGRHRNASSTPGLEELDGALDSEALKRFGLPLLPEFSTMPFPKVEAVEMSSGYTLYNVAGTEVGPKSAVDFALGVIGRKKQLMRDGDGRRLYQLTFNHVRKPVAMGIQEVLLHRPSFGEAEPKLMVYEYIEGMNSQEAVRKAHQYPVEEKLVRVGRADTVRLAELPRYREMVEFGAGRVGWDLSEFEVWRVKMAYPIPYSSVRIYVYVE